MREVTVIAEAGSCHDNDISKAYNLIDAAKECGADICKWQFWSSSKALAERRKVRLAEPIYAKYKLPEAWLEPLCAHSEKVGIEFMCTAYLIEDIPIVAPYVKRFKVSAFESQWAEFMNAHATYGKPLIASVNPGMYPQWDGGMYVNALHCISKYPTPIDELNIWRIAEDELDGLSDHTTSTLTGAFAVAAGAKLIEKHIRLFGTAEDNPDFGHSLRADGNWIGSERTPFAEYIRNIREAGMAV